MLAYEPDETIAHRLDPRSKLAVQVGFATTALAHTGPLALVALTVLAGAIGSTAGVKFWKTLAAYRFALVVLAIAPLIATLTLGPPWLDFAAGLETARASYRVGLILLVSAAYIRSTPIRATRAAIQRTVPGKTGQLLGVGIALVVRFLPLLKGDLRRIREAMDARLGSERSLTARLTLLGVVSLSRGFDRADRLALALRARCFSWNPTLPALSFTRLDGVVVVLAAGLALTALL